MSLNAIKGMKSAKRIKKGIESLNRINLAQFTGASVIASLEAIDAAQKLPVILVEELSEEAEAAKQKAYEIDRCWSPYEGSYKFCTARAHGELLTEAARRTRFAGYLKNKTTSNCWEQHEADEGEDYLDSYTVKVCTDLEIAEYEADMAERRIIPVDDWSVPETEQEV